MKAKVTTAFHGVDNHGGVNFFNIGNEIDGDLSLNAVDQGLAEWIEEPDPGMKPKITQTLEPYRIIVPT